MAHLFSLGFVPAYDLVFPLHPIFPHPDSFLDWISTLSPYRNTFSFVGFSNVAPHFLTCASPPTPPITLTVRLDAQ